MFEYIRNFRIIFQSMKTPFQAIGRSDPKYKEARPISITDLTLMLRLAKAPWPWVFQSLIIGSTDVICSLESIFAVSSIIMTDANAENVGANVVDIACMSQIALHVHAALLKRSSVMPAIQSILDVASVMEECATAPMRKRMRKWAYIVRGINLGTFFAIGFCLLVCFKLNPPEGQTTYVAMWPAPTLDMPVTMAVISYLQLYATLFGSFVFCVVSSIHFGAILHAVGLFAALDSCVRRLHLYSDSADIRYEQLLKYAKCHQTLLRAMVDINAIGKDLLFSRVNATYAVLVYTGMSISLGFIGVRVMWMTAFGFGTLLQLTVTGQCLKDSADRMALAFFESKWNQENAKFRKIIHIAVMRTYKTLNMSTWFCKNCDLPFFIELVKSWYSAVQMMYKARTRTSRRK